MVSVLLLITFSSPAWCEPQYKIHDDCLGSWKSCAAHVMKIDEFDAEFARYYPLWPTYQAEGTLSSPVLFDEDPWSNGKGRLNCQQGRTILAEQGFRRVRSLECDGRAYTYLGRHGGMKYRITLNSMSGRILSVEPI